MAAQYNCIIIDDEVNAIGLLSSQLSELYPNIAIEGKYTNWEDGLKALRSLNIDLVFLDISMAGKNGMDLLKLVPELESEVIFVTAYSEYALEAFKYFAAGYLLKPIDETEFISTVNNAILRIKNKKLATPTIEHESSIANKIGIPSMSGIDYVEKNDIVYLESIDGYTKVIMKQGEIISSYRIGRFSPLLDNKQFYRVHRSFIVNLHNIRRYTTNGEILMSNNKEIPVSKNNLEEFLNLFYTVSNTDKPKDGQDKNIGKSN